MDTVFVKDVRLNGPAHVSGLRPGDRLLSVNGMAVAGTLYADVVKAIQQTRAVLKLIVVPKDCDILQTVNVLLILIYIYEVIGIYQLKIKIFLSFSFLANQHTVLNQINGLVFMQIHKN